MEIFDLVLIQCFLSPYICKMFDMVIASMAASYFIDQFLPKRRNSQK